MKIQHSDHQGRRSTRLRGLAVLQTIVLVLVASTARGADEEEAIRYTVEVAAAATMLEAEEVAQDLRERLGAEIGIRLEFRGGTHRVRAGLIPTVQEGQRLLSRIRELGYEEAWIAAVSAMQLEPEWQGPGTRTDQAAAEEQADAAKAAAQPAAAPIDPEAAAAQAELEAEATEAAPAEPAVLVEPIAPPPRGREIRAWRVAEPPVIDGRLDEAVWEQAPFVADFKQKAARGGFPPRERTEVAILYDEEALYIGGRMMARDPSAIRARKGQRDDQTDTDRLIVSLDTYRNRQTAYNFGVTAGGVRVDYYQPQDVFEVRDYSYDPVWRAATSINGDSWTAEMRIPLSSLRFHGGVESQLWGINIQRVSPAMRVRAFWVVVPGNETGWSSRFGDLVGLDSVKPVRRVAVVPYVVGQTAYVDAEASTGSPLEDGETDWNVGGDLLADLTSDVSLEATFNPDFAQIEADPAIVNLTDYEVFFPEKRPFFLEGAQLLQGPGPRYYYSRRIGAPPSVGTAGLEEVPRSTTIPGAAKIIGRLPRGRSLGALLAVSDEEEALGFDSGAGTLVDVPVQPLTFYGVGRLQKDFGAGSTMGVVGTGVRRDFAAEGTLGELLPLEAWAGGFDWNLRFRKGTHQFGGFAGGSLVEGSPESILRLQRASSRYLQRPDADHIGVDVTRTKLQGYTAGVNVGRIQGSWRWVASGEARSPAFEINDAGAMATADDIDGFVEVAYGDPLKHGPWQRIDVSASLASGWNFGEVRQYTTPAVDLTLVWNNFWRTYLRVAQDQRALSDSLTRGGPLMGTGEGTRSRFGLSTNNTRRFVWSLDGGYSSDEFGARGYTASTRFLLRSPHRFTFSITPGYEESRDARQYVATLANGRPETFGQRYVFGELDRDTVFARLRMGVALTNKLSFDVYVEPFAATGTYDVFGELLAAGSRDLRIYGTDGTTIVQLPDGSYQITDGDRTFTLGNSDFDVLSLRGNAVLRWDYAQGSALYFVWSHNRADEDVIEGAAGAANLGDVFDVPAEDVLALKLSYRLDFN